MSETVVATPAVTSSGSPYLGLGPYQEADAPFFFGRAREIDLITANLIASRLTILYGPSGVGKSSLLRAGVVRQLTERERRELADDQEPDFVPVYYASWHQDPVAGLVQHIMDALARTVPDAPVSPDPPSSLIAAIERWGETTTADLLLLLDQFEELFLYHDRPDGGATPFDEQLAAAVTRPDLQVNVLLSLREDALANLDRYKRSIPRLFQNYLRVEPLRRDAAREAITGPIDRYNAAVDEAQRVTIEPALVETVLASISTAAPTSADAAGANGTSPAERADDPIETSHLQLVMTRLWSKEQEEQSRTLRHATLVDELGGATAIVRNHFDEVMARFDAPEQALAEEVFGHLVTPSGSKIAHTTRDLAAWAAVPEDELQPVLGKLTTQRNRILRHVPPPLDRPHDVTYEIFHDLLAAAAADWRQRRRQEHELQRAQDERDEALRGATEQRRRARRSLALAVVALAACVVALAFFYTADRATDAANEAKKGLETAEIAARQGLSVFSDPAVRLAQARTAVRDAPDSELAVEMLRRLLTDSLLDAQMAGHTAQILDLEVNPRGNDMLTVARDTSARIWDVETGDEQQVMTNDAGWNMGVYDSAGARIALAGRDGSVRVHDAADGTLIRRIDAAHSGEGGTWVVAFSPNPDAPQTLASAGVDGHVILWDIERGSGRQLLQRHDSIVETMAFSPDGALLLTGGVDGTARIWDVASGEQVAVLERDVAVNDVHFAPRSTSVVVASGTAAVIWDWTDDTTVILDRHPRTVSTAVFDPTGTSVLTTSDKQAYLWNATTGERLEEFSGHLDWVNTGTFDADGRRIVTASADGTVRVWDVERGGSLHVLRGHQGDVVDAVFDGEQRVVSAGADGTARVWRLPTGRRLEGFDDWVLDATFDPTGELVAGAGVNGEIRVWQADTGTVRQEFETNALSLRTVEFSADGRLLLTASQDGYVAVWDRLRPAEPLAERSMTTPSYAHLAAAAFSPVDPAIAVVAGPAGAALWHWKGDTITAWLQRDTLITAVAFGPDGTRIAIGDEFGQVALYDGQGTPLDIPMDGHRSFVQSMAFSPDATRLLTAGRDGTARIWDATSGDLVHELVGTQQGSPQAAYSPDGRLVATASPDGTIAMWNAATGDLLTHVQTHADYVNAVDFDPDDPRTVVTASDDHTAFMYRCETCGDVDALLQLADARLEQIAVRETATPAPQDSACYLDNGGAVDCDQPHDLEFFAAPDHPAAPGAPYDQSTVEEYGQEQCRGAALEQYVGSSYEDSQYFVVEVVPDVTQWIDGARWISCYLYLDDEQMVGSAQGSGQ